MDTDKIKKGISDASSTLNKLLVDSAQWAKENPVLAAAMVVGVRNIAKATKKRSEDSDKRNQRMVWDPAARHYWETKRVLKQSEWLEVERLKKQQGMTVGEALNALNLLKR